MKLTVQKKLAAKVMKRSPKKIKLDPEKLGDIKEAITKKDIRELIKDDTIKVETSKGVSRGRAKKSDKQKAKGRQRGPGSRKGKKTARQPKKETWMRKIRSQRKLLKDLRERSTITNATFTELYRKAGGGFFRSQRHIKLYITEHKLAVVKEK